MGYLTPTLLYPIFLLSLPNLKSPPRIKLFFLTLVSLVQIRPNQFSENFLFYSTLLYPSNNQGGPGRKGPGTSPS